MTGQRPYIVLALISTGLLNTPSTAEEFPLLALFANSLRCNGASAAEGRPAVAGTRS